MYGNLPFSPAKTPFFYGWIILVAGAIGVVMSIPGQTMGVSVFTDPLIESLEISRLNLSLAYMLGTLSSSLMLSKAGKQYDKFGARVTAVSASFFMGAVLLYMSRLETITLWLNTTLKIPFGIAAFILITPGFFALRFFGQGVLTMVSRNMVMKWFDRKRGLAAALMGVITAFGFAYAPKPFNSLINSFGWDGAWKILGFAALFIFPFFIMLFYRDNPEICLLRPDGESETKPGKDKEFVKESVGSDITLKEAKKTAVFWIAILIVAIWALYNTAITFHIVSIFALKGMNSATAVSIFLPYSVFSVLSRLFTGWLSDRCRLKYIMLIQLVSSAAALLFLMTLSRNAVIMWGFIAFLGITSGSWGVLNSITWIRLFGKKHLGEITGFAMGWIVAGSAFGPYIFSISENMTGGYGIAVLFCVIFVSLIGLLTIFKVKR
jgi:MFS family permease